MNISNMKNIIVLKNLPSNLVEEAIVVLKENKRVKKYQYIDSDINKKTAKDNKIDNNKENANHNSLDANNSKEYILKEAEMVISNYISNLEKKSTKWNSNMKKIEKKYKTSLVLNFVLGFATIISIALCLI